MQHGNSGNITCADRPERRKIRLKESNAKCRYLKNLPVKGTLRQVFTCLRPPPLLDFVWGGVAIL